MKNPHLKWNVSALCSVHTLRTHTHTHQTMLPFLHLVVDGWARIALQKIAHTHANICAFYYLYRLYSFSFPVTQLVIIVRDDTHWLRRRSHSNALSILSLSMHSLSVVCECVSYKHFMHLFLDRCRSDYECIWVHFFSLIYSFNEKEQKSRRKYFSSADS